VFPCVILTKVEIP